MIDYLNHLKEDIIQNLNFFIIMILWILLFNFLSNILLSIELNNLLFEFILFISNMYSYVGFFSLLFFTIFLIIKNILNLNIYLFN